MIVMIDNYDSFTYNLVQYLGELGETLRVFRNDQIAVKQIRRLAPQAIVISPGPGSPKDAGISNELIRTLGGTIPILGVCLGHQCIGEVFGGQVVRAKRPMHGKTSAIHHDRTHLFRGLPNPFEATRYHSLIVQKAGLPSSLIVTAWTVEPHGQARGTFSNAPPGANIPPTHRKSNHQRAPQPRLGPDGGVEGEIMGLRHRSLPVYGVQFHPESILTKHGKELLRNFLELAKRN